ncbi:MAG TPA: glycoside hydrolase family 25 protein [Thermoleophilaceae bacterium]|jgi:GH25 family lysozyme M1 (1,4-beta-N-acetylmuramidase)|nr:glycoside hydrolase family 25 protein [Thermoleophilaceae bacterium]
MPHSLRAVSLALAIAAATPTAALANPANDFAGSHAPSRLKHRAAAAAVPTIRSGLIGPDVSNWNGCSLNWSAVARVRAFAFTKATEGTTFTDRCFARHWRQLALLGLPHAAYHFARPRLPIGSARAQARHYVAVVNAAGGFARTLPPVLDVEVKSGPLSVGFMRRWVSAWIDEVRAETHRYRVTIYTGDWFWRPNVGSWAPRGTLLWASGYTTRVPRVAGFRKVSWWQYTDGVHGPRPHSTPGIGPADHSVWLDTAARLARLKR